MIEILAFMRRHVKPGETRGQSYVKVVDPSGILTSCKLSEGGHPMDSKQYSTLMDALTDVPDPRNARGKQYPWTLLLTLVCSALASGERSGHGIASWVAEHATILVVRLRLERGRSCRQRSRAKWSY